MVRKRTIFSALVIAPRFDPTLKVKGRGQTIISARENDHSPDAPGNQIRAHLGHRGGIGAAPGLATKKTGGPSRALSALYPGPRPDQALLLPRHPQVPRRLPFLPPALERGPRFFRSQASLLPLSRSQRPSRGGGSWRGAREREPRDVVHFDRRCADLHAPGPERLSLEGRTAPPREKRLSLWRRIPSEHRLATFFPPRSPLHPEALARLALHGSQPAVDRSAEGDARGVLLREACGEA